jgi:hypothetical protein
MHYLTGILHAESTQYFFITESGFDFSRDFRLTHDPDFFDRNRIRKTAILIAIDFIDEENLIMHHTVIS